MKINHVITSIDITTGGPARSVTHLIAAMLEIDTTLNIGIDTLKSETPITTTFNTSNSAIRFHTFEKLQRSKSLVNSLVQSEVSLFHGQGLWQMPVHQMAKVARKKGVPYIITPRGMLEPWALTQGKLKKQLALKLFQYKDLEKATCLHATAPMEVESIRALGLKNPIAMIPNGVNIAQFPAEAPIKANTPKRLLFLSRIHIKKGIENLIEAWQQVDVNLKQDWVIDIYGNGDPEYIASLKAKIKAANLEEQISIKPPVFGNEKTKVFNQAALFVLPTFSENFGIVVAEALASFTPVITTKGTPWEELNTNNCGQWIEIGVSPLVNALNAMLAKSPEALQQMGANGRQLIEQKYSMQAVAKQMLALYDWILNSSNTPDFIDIV
ncbi:glycosyltransferase [Olleya namhaensis]|uniref:glycosyltransferase n=1 Tax=Olleya namhaensis TaxID=1144750 RepID=UPI0024921BBC|nr:glycosyltransferase [Olleya namhaensis]